MFLIPTSRTKKIIAGIALVSLSFGAGQVFDLTPEVPKTDIADIQPSVELQKILDWQTNKPKTNAEWAEDVKVESMELKFDNQLQEMLESHQKKLDEKYQPMLDRALTYPDAIRAELYDAGMRGQELEDQFAEKINNLKFETEKLRQSVERIAKEIELRDKGFLTVKETIPAGDPKREAIHAKGSKERSPLGTTYYIQFTCNTPGNGTTTDCDGGADDSFNSLDAFADNARSAGDIAWVRGGMASTTAITDVSFTSDGNLNNPITIARDMDNLWGDFATSTETWTVQFGSKFMQSSASSTTVFGDKWIWVGNDVNPDATTPTVYGKDYLYEVKTASSTGAELYLPYKGPSTGSGNALRVLPTAPQWNVTTGDFQFLSSVDDYWYIQGLDLRGSDVNCVLHLQNSAFIVKDTILQTNALTDCGIRDTYSNNSYLKLRMFNTTSGFLSGVGTVFTANDVLIDCNNVASSAGVFDNSNNPIYSMTAYDLTVINCSVFLNSASAFSNITVRNIQFNNLFSSLAGDRNSRIFFEDKFGQPGLNIFVDKFTDADTNSTTTISDTSNLRSGGGPKNELVFPPSGTANTGISTKMFPQSFIKLFEYPIYADTTSKTYSVFFNSTSTAHWTADPTASEFWIECEYYGHASNAERFLKKSTDVIDFNGSTAWESLDVTCQPTQSGILYLRGWYGKPRETNADDTNVFFMDITPTIQ